MTLANYFIRLSRPQETPKRFLKSLRMTDTGDTIIECNSIFKAAGFHSKENASMIVNRLKYTKDRCNPKILKRSLN